MSVQLSVKVRSDAVRANFLQFTQENEADIADVLRGAMEKARTLVATAPPEYSGEPEHYWASAAQRAFVMLSVAFPYVRTGAYEKSWIIEDVKNGLRLRSSHPQARLMAGTAGNADSQYYLHKGRWVPLRVAVEESVTTLPVDIQESVYTTARRRGFAR